MIILHITNCLRGGGIQNFILSLLPEQASMGHKVFLVVIEKYDYEYCFHLERILSNNNVTVIRLNKSRSNKISLIKTIIKCRNLIKSINPDIVGWIQIPGTVIDYPVCWRANDNEYYMKHSAEGERRAFGAIMLDGANSSAAEEHLVVLYGHHMRNGTMFKDIVRYTDADFLNDHKSISLFFPDREERYSVIGTIVCSAKNFEPSQMVEEELLFKEWCRNSWKGLPEEEIQKKMLALVTCSYGSRDERTICFAVAEN